MSYSTCEHARQLKKKPTLPWASKHNTEDKKVIKSANLRNIRPQLEATTQFVATKHRFQFSLPSILNFLGRFRRERNVKQYTITQQYVQTMCAMNENKKVSQLTDVTLFWYGTRRFHRNWNVKLHKQLKLPRKYVKKMCALCVIK